MNWNLTDQEAAYIIDLLKARPLGESIGLFTNLMRQSQTPPVRAQMGEQIPGMESKAPRRLNPVPDQEAKPAA